MGRKTDYSQSTYYCIKCKNPEIKDIYVGLTTNFRDRKSVHKHDCNNPEKNHIKLYTFINNNGGWDNWETQLLETYSCANLAEARLREQHWLNELKPTLNSNKSIMLKKEEVLVLADNLSARERRLAQSNWRRECLKEGYNLSEVLKDENVELKEENEKLKIEIEKLKIEIESLKSLKEENIKIKQLLSIYLNKS
jgi:hypothetical protein